MEENLLIFGAQAALRSSALLLVVLVLYWMLRRSGTAALRHTLLVSGLLTAGLVLLAMARLPAWKVLPADAAPVSEASASSPALVVAEASPFPEKTSKPVRAISMQRLQPRVPEN